MPAVWNADRENGMERGLAVFLSQVGMPVCVVHGVLELLFISILLCDVFTVASRYMSCDCVIAELVLVCMCVQL